MNKHALAAVVEALASDIGKDGRPTQDAYELAAAVVKLASSQGAGSKALPVQVPRVKPSPHEKLGKPVKLKVKRVDAFEVRNRSLDAQEFGNFATHLQFPDLIPEGEVWVADTVTDDELPHLLQSAEAQLRAHAGGSNEDESYEYGLSVERAERERDTAIGGERPHHDEIPPDIYKGLWKTVQGRHDPIKVWIVDGLKVRNMFKTDFVEGGNVMVYPFVPYDEVWIEDQVADSERPFVLLHEFTERDLMHNEQADYDDAHTHASKVEFKARKQFQKDGTLPAVGYGKAKALVTANDDPETARPNSPRHVSHDKPTESLLIRTKGNLFGLDDDKHTTPVYDNPPTALQLRDEHRVTDQLTKGFNEPSEKSLKAHKWGCLMLRLPAGTAKEIADWGLENILEAHLGPDGRELTAHVTVVYGLDDGPDLLPSLRGILARCGPIPVRLASRPSIFEGPNKDGIPLKIDVESEPLRELNALITGSFPTPGNTHTDYHPHITLAYLSGSEVAPAYTRESPPFGGSEVVVTEALYTGADGSREEFQLGFLPMLGSKSVGETPHAPPAPRPHAAPDPAPRPRRTTQLAPASEPHEEEPSRPAPVSTPRVAPSPYRPPPESGGRAEAPPAPKPPPVPAERPSSGAGMPETTEEHARQAAGAREAAEYHPAEPSERNDPSNQNRSPEGLSPTARLAQHRLHHFGTTADEIRADSGAYRELVGMLHGDISGHREDVVDALRELGIPPPAATFHQAVLAAINWGDQDRIDETLARAEASLSAADYQKLVEGLPAVGRRKPAAGGRKPVAGPLGKNKPLPKVQVESYPDEGRRRVEEIFGRPLEAAELGALANATDGAKITVKPLRQGVVKVTSTGNGVTAERVFKRDSRGDLVVDNAYFSILRGTPYRGRGYELFADQVAALREVGIKTIQTYACGNKGNVLNGYITWPKLGYSGTIDDEHFGKLSEHFQEELGDSREIRDLMDLPGGAEEWEEKGGSIHDATFDTTPGSRNMEALEAYIAKRKMRPIRDENGVPYY